MSRRFQGTSLAVLAAVPLLLVVVATADATTMSYTASVPLTATDWATSLSFPQFNPSLGTLNSVTLSLDGHIGGSAGIENLNATKSATVTLGISTAIQLGGAGTPSVTTMPSFSATTTLAAFGGTINFLPSSGMTYTGISSDTSSSTTNSLPSDLAPFIGTSTIDLPISTLTTVTTVGGTSSGLASYADLSASAGATVTYNYTVPEPGTLLLLGSGLLGLFVWRKRRS